MVQEVKSVTVDADSIIVERTAILISILATSIFVKTISLHTSLASTTHRVVLLAIWVLIFAEELFGESKSFGT
jgi:hypothetical protein